MPGTLLLVNSRERFLALDRGAALAREAERVWRSAVAAAAAIQKLALTAPRITIHSPTKPAVPGKPQLAMENNTAKAANLGMVLATPP